MGIAQNWLIRHRSEGYRCNDAYTDLHAQLLFQIPQQRLHPFRRLPIGKGRLQHHDIDRLFGGGNRHAPGRRAAAAGLRNPHAPSRHRCPLRAAAAGPDTASARVRRQSDPWRHRHAHLHRHQRPGRPGRAGPRRTARTAADAVRAAVARRAAGHPVRRPAVAAAVVPDLPAAQRLPLDGRAADRPGADPGRHQRPRPPDRARSGHRPDHHDRCRGDQLRPGHRVAQQPPAAPGVAVERPAHADARSLQPASARSAAASSTTA